MRQVVTPTSPIAALWATFGPPNATKEEAAAAAELAALMAQAGEQDPRAWRAETLLHALVALVKRARPGVTEATMVARLVALLTFLKRAATSPQVGVSPTELAQVIAAYQRQVAPADARMPFALATLDALLAKTSQWVDAFIAATPNSTLTADARLVHQVAEMWTEAAYSMCRQGPATWDQTTVEMITTRFIPAQAPFAAEECPLIGTILAHWLRFLGSAGMVSDMRARELANAVTALTPTMVRLAADPTRWSDEKRVLMAVREAGIDPGDEDALAAYTRAVVEREVVAEAATVPQPSYTHPLLYVPGDATSRLHLAHAPNGRKWQAKTRRRVHQAGVQLARRLWSAPTADGLRHRVSQELMVDTVTHVFDAMYAQHLATVPEWRELALSGVLQELAGQTPPLLWPAVHHALTDMLCALAAQGVWAEPRAIALCALPSRVKGRDRSIGQVVSLNRFRNRRSDGLSG